MSLIKDGAGIVSLKIFHEYVDEKKKNPQYVLSRCGRVHINSTSKKIGLSYKLQPSLLKQEMEHDEIYEGAWETKEDEWLSYLKTDELATAFCYAR